MNTSATQVCRRQIFCLVAVATACTLYAQAGIAQPRAAEQPCCQAVIDWAIDSRSPKATVAKTLARLGRRLEKASARFRENGVCLNWRRREGLPELRQVFVGGRRLPQLAQVHEDTPLSKGALGSVRFVDNLRYWDALTRRYRRRAGATPVPGAKVAVVRWRDRPSDGVVATNELLHVFGLRDEEMGVTQSRGTHHVDASMWAFVRKVCAAEDDEARRTLIRRRLVGK